MPLNKNTHTHKYGRIKMGREKNYIVYKCFLDCPHYIPPELVIGRKSLCWQCNKEFSMTKLTLKLKPVCPNCKGSESESESFESDNLLKSLGIEIG